MGYENTKRLRDLCRTPDPMPENYDWRKEPWVDEKKVRALSHYIAHHVLTALAADSMPDNSEEDEQVLLLLSPEATEPIWRSPQADEIIRYRVACAAAMGIDKVISAWIKDKGSIDLIALTIR